VPGIGKPERGHVLDRLAKETIELLFAGLDLRHVMEPVRHRLGMARLVALPDALGRGVARPIAIGQRLVEAAMP
jgi:hypothetical protein